MSTQGEGRRRCRRTKGKKCTNTFREEEKEEEKEKPDGRTQTQIHTPSNANQAKRHLETHNKKG